MSDADMSLSTVEFTVRDHVAHIRLNRPAAGNALNLELARDLLAAARRSRDDGTVRAVLLSGAGTNFCVGGDLKSFSAHGAGMDAHLREVLANLHPAVETLADLEAPVIAAVQGAAAGAGMSLACACDIVVAGESTRFTLAYTRVGLSPDGSATFFLPRVVGLRRALELAITNRVLTAREALEWGLVTAVAPDHDIIATAEQLVIQLAAGPTAAFAATRHLLRTSFAHTLKEQLERELDAIATVAGQPDGQEGVAAFVAKRPPTFGGR